jgi:GNAT superfamily N-acetyltransferase
VVRRAEPNDADAVLALMAGLGRPEVAADPAEQAATFRAHLDHPDAEIFISELDGAIAGAASLWFRLRLNWTTPEAWVPDLYVDPAFRRQGAASELLDACLQAARKRGCHGLVLASGHQRAEAHQLYENYGFTHSGRVYGLMLT